MRSFNANFITEKNKRADGPVPVNLLKFNFATPVYISDRDVTPPGGNAHSGLVRSWGFIDTSVSQTEGAGVLGVLEIQDLQLRIINSESPRFSDSFTDEDPPENVIVEMYQWFEGLQNSEKEIIFKGIIYGQPVYDEYYCDITVRGIFQKYNWKIGEDKIIRSADYPDVDPDDIGKMQNIIYGSHECVPCRSVKSGAVDSLESSIDEDDTSIVLSYAGEYASSGTVKCDEEEITYTGKSGNTLTGCTRGANGTTATSHLVGASIWQELESFVYQVASHPVKSIDDVYVDGQRVTSVATRYTGQSGDELTGYEGQAVFTVPSRLTRAQAIDLLVNDGIVINDGIGVSDTIGVNDGISVNDAISVVDTIGVSDGISISDLISVLDTIGVSDGISVSDNIGVSTTATTKSIYPSGSLGQTGHANIIDGSSNTYCELDAGQSCRANFPSTNYGTIVKQHIHFIAGGVGLDTIGITYGMGWSPTSIEAGDISEYRVSKDGGNWDDYIIFNAPTGVNDRRIFEVLRKEVEYIPTVTKTGSASKSGTVSKTGAASKSGSVSKSGTVSKTGAASKSGSVTRSGNVTKTGAAAKSGTVTRSGAVTLTGNSVADVRVGKLVTVDVDGYRDDDAGTYTGTPYALIERPDHVFKHIWCVLLEAPSGYIDAATFAAAGTFYNTHSYAFSILIDEPVQAEGLLMRLALQCRSRFVVTAYGTVKLVVRQLSQSSGHSISKNEIMCDSISVRRSATTDLINYFNVYYDPDRTQSRYDPGSYLGCLECTDATSITRYGRRDWSGSEDVFCFDAVRSEAMAEHVAAFLLEYHAAVRRMPCFSVFLDNMEIEPADVIDVTHPLDSMSGFTADVIKTIHHPGSARQDTIDHVEVVTVEN
ncbi:MAG: hypothetical protein JW884_14285 [Deltaproteobacteria bacterium]|nr:hypothetical protein [Deltaproteobacteria bacterium]